MSRKKGGKRRLSSGRYTLGQLTLLLQRHGELYMTIHAPKTAGYQASYGNFETSKPGEIPAEEVNRFNIGEEQREITNIAFADLAIAFQLVEDSTRRYVETLLTSEKWSPVVVSPRKVLFDTPYEAQHLITLLQAMNREGRFEIWQRSETTSSSPTGTAVGSTRMAA